MNQPVPLEWVTSFVQTNQALVQHLATALLSSGGAHGADFQSYSQLAQVQQDYLQRMSAVWANAPLDGIYNSLEKPKSDKRFGGEEWGKSPLHTLLKDSYLINTRYVNDLIDHSGLDSRPVMLEYERFSRPSDLRDHVMLHSQAGSCLLEGQREPRLFLPNAP